MLPNPYAPGELPRVLAGREQQQDRIRGYLSRIGTYGEMGGPLLVFQGPRGVGKTSLLREAQRDAEAHRFITAWVACRRNAPFLPDLVSRVGKAIETADILPRAEKGSWRLRLESIGVDPEQRESRLPENHSILIGLTGELLEQSPAFGVGLRGLGGECLCQT